MKKVLITGSSRGIGKAIALELKQKGYEIIGTATSKKGIDSLSKHDITGLLLDLNSRDSIEKFIEILQSNHSDISILINNAGITQDNIVVSMKEKEWMDVINIHLNGTFTISKKVLKFMLKERWGRIINITSASASIGNRGQSNYAAAKSGVEAFSKSLSKEVGSRGITVNCLAPGYIDTDMTSSITMEQKTEINKLIPLKRFGKPEEIAKMVSFLISDDGSYITGQTIHVNGGLYM
jgi:3-oxoacyl-[acyl-carrier protein] reductase